MPGEHDWRAALDAFLTAAPPDLADPLEPPPAGGLGLTFALRTVPARTAYRWNGPVSTALAAVPADGLDTTHRCGVRPVLRGPRGWSQAGLAWSNLSHLGSRHQLDPDQHRWCIEFGALYRAAGPVTGRDPDWVFLDDYANPALWTLLDQAAALGVALVTGRGRDGAVQRAGSATVGLDAQAGPAGVRVRPHLVVDGAVLPAHRARPIGRHGVYAVDGSGRLVLAPSAGRLSDEQVAALGRRPDPLVLPAEALAEFVTDYLPRIRARIDVTSADGSVPLPDPAPPTLVLTAAHHPGHVLALTWSWEAGRPGARPDPAALLPPDLVPAAWIPGDAAVPVPVTLRGLDAADFVVERLPRLRTLPGVRVEVRGRTVDYRAVEGDPDLAVTVLPTEKPDWFSLGVTVAVDGHEIPFHPLFTALARGRRRLLLPDGRYLSLDHPSLARLTELIEESARLDEWEPLLPISRHRLATLWPDFEDLAERSPETRRWRALVAEAARARPEPVPPPPGLRATLRPYQQGGLDWLAFLWRHRLGGILADDMGLGKTLQCLALIQQVVTAGKHRPFLVVAPTSVVPTWVAEAARFTPDLTVVAVGATDAAAPVPLATAVAGAQLVVTSYALFRLDTDAYRALPWAGLFLDEAQFVKNPATRVHQAAADLPVEVKIAVTGTPMENSLTDLHALCAIVAPGLFPSAPRFQRDFVRPIEAPMTGISAGVGAGTAPEVAARVRSERLARLRRRVRPFLLRRHKADVAVELPPRQEQVLRVELEPEHRHLYDVYLQRERRKVLRVLDEEDPNHRFIVFRSLTLLRLLALDAGLVDEEHDRVGSAKLDLLVAKLEQMRAEGHRALVFSQFTGYLTKVAGRLDEAGLPYAWLDGSTRRREAVVRDFRSGTAPVFLISLKAGGVGLNLTEADYVFLLDPWWNPAAEQQAIDRTHRIGQTSPVLVYRLVAADTIEEKVVALQQRKSALFAAVVDGEDYSAAGLSTDDLRTLFA